LAFGQSRALTRPTGVLADQVDMSKSGLFAHFKSKDEVQIDLLEYATNTAVPI
jgi:AcrR family transcriptional regulator